MHGPASVRGNRGRPSHFHLPSVTEPTRKGKIASLPLVIREEVNQRLLDGQKGPKILAWLNADERVLTVLDELWGEEPVSAQNLSEWRQGGYQDWLKRREQIEQTKSLSTYALKLAQASGGNISDGAAAIMAGKILELIEAGPVTEIGEDGKEREIFDVGGFTKALVALRSTDLDARKVAQRERFLDQKERQVALAEKQFQVRTSELFLKFYQDKKAKEIVEGGGKREVQISLLRELMFGSEEQNPDAGETQKD